MSDNGSERTVDHSILKILVWATLFQCAWHRERIFDVLSEGALVSADDFLRLLQVRDWMNGQAWFDSNVYRMGVESVGDLHWTRLVDLPIAGLIYFFDLFFDALQAERITSIIWPYILFLATVLVIVKICSKLFPSADKLLTLFFIVTCVVAILEFAPGRIDHHNIQILLLSLSLFGFVNSEKKWGGYLVGSSIALSIVVGLDTMLLLILMLGWLGLEWAFFIDRNGRQLVKTAIGIIVSLLILFPLFVPSTEFFRPVYDAISIVYFTVFLLIAFGFIFLANLSSRLKTIQARLFVGVVIAAVALAITHLLFPLFILGPYGTISIELLQSWLSSITEAKGLIAIAKSSPSYWICCIGYLIFIAAVGAFLVFKHGIGDGKLIGVYAIFIVSALASFIQMRAMRVGVITSIPICIWAVQYISAFLKERFSLTSFGPKIANFVGVVLLSNVSWYAAGIGLEAGLAYRSAVSAKLEDSNSPNTFNINTIYDWHKDVNLSTCTKNGYFETLRKLPTGRILNELNIGPSILVFSDHKIVSANYHRNEKGILNTLHFFNGDEMNARDITKKLQIQYVAICQLIPGNEQPNFDKTKFGAKLLRGKAPNWLEKVSLDEDRLLIYKVIN